jgi:DNA (cytosine-5)-methyltransferase 1
MNCVSLFSGCLGLDLGLEEAGIQTSVCVEKDSTCRKTIRLNRPNITIFEDVFQVTGKQLIKAAGGSVDIVVGGPPCQSFSTIGKRKFTKDIRGKALFEYIRLIKEIKPEYFVFENVRGILSAMKGKKLLIDWILNEFRTMGYNTVHGLLDSSNYGSPQKRQRVIVLGSRSGKISLPAFHAPQKYVLGDVIRDLNEINPAECTNFSNLIKGFLDKIPAGGNWKNLPVPDQDRVMGKTDRSSGGLTSYLRRLSYNLPCPTLLTTPTGRATTLCHPEFTRPLSVPEYRRIQGFPDTWKLEGTVREKYTQLGNAVPIQLAKAIGWAITKI